MAKNIDFMGATFPDVPSIQLPQHEGGLVSFDDTSDATATAGDIAKDKTAYANGEKLVGTHEDVTVDPISITSNGTYSASSGHAYSPVSVNVPSIVPTGSQTFTENGTYDVTSIAEAVVNVAGGGGASNFVSGEFTTQSTNGTQIIDVPYSGSGYPIAILIYVKNGIYYSTWDYAYAVGAIAIIKTKLNVLPTFDNDSYSENRGCVLGIYKTSKGTSNSIAGSTSATIYSQSAPSNTRENVVKMSDNKTMKIYVQATSYGFVKDTSYTYHIIYTT